MKDHIKVTRYLDLDGPLDVALSRLQDLKAEGLVAVNLQHEGYESYGMEVTGWRPMTADELAKQAGRRERQREASRKARVTRKQRDEEAFLRTAQRLGYRVSNGPRKPKKRA